jgi:hypothetical protein
MKSAQSDELFLIKESLLIPMLLSIFQRDINIMKNFKSPDPYIENNMDAMNLATLELSSIKKVFSKRGIKILITKNEPLTFRASYLCRGYQGEFSMLWTFVQPEIQIRMRRYFGKDITKLINNDRMNDSQIKQDFFEPPPIQMDKLFLIRITKTFKRRRPLMPSCAFL